MIVVFGGTIIVAKSMNMQLPPSDRKKDSHAGNWQLCLFVLV